MVAERLLITKLKKTDSTTADLFGARHRFKDLTLFEISDLLTVGIDPNELPLGEEVPCRFYALFELSEKLNKANRPYKDVVALERIDAPATAGSMDSSAILAELRRITAHLTALVKAQGLEVPELEDPEPEPADPIGGNGGRPNGKDAQTAETADLTEPAEVTEPPPAVFANPDAAHLWACTLGAFSSAEAAALAYESVKNRNKPKTAAEMRDLWVSFVIKTRLAAA